METRILIVEEQDQGVRLDKYLSTAMDDCSRSRAQQLIDQEAVRIDDLPVKNSYKVKAGDEIEVTLPDEEALEALKDAGVTVSELTPEDFKAAGQAFYEDPQIKAMWSEGLIEEMKTIIGRQD